MDLQEPTRKMSKSVSSPLGTVLVFDPPEEIDRKVRKAVTDTETVVRYDPESKPGVSNLLQLLAAATGAAPSEVAARYTSYGPLKTDLSAALVELLRPVRERYVELEADPGHVVAVLAAGAAKAHAVAAVTLDRAMRAAGLLPPADRRARPAARRPSPSPSCSQDPTMRFHSLIRGMKRCWRAPGSRTTMMRGMNIVKGRIR